MADFEKYRSRRIIEVKILPDGRVLQRGSKEITDKETLDRDWERVPEQRPTEEKQQQQH